MAENVRTSAANYLPPAVLPGFTVKRTLLIANIYFCLTFINFASMLKDIQKEEVKDIGIAVVKESEADNDWRVYLINLSDTRLENVIINSTGFGLDSENERLETATFRHYIETVKPRTAIAFETIMEEVFPLSNRFWLSYYIDKKIFDRKYEFVPGSISPDFFVSVPFTNKKGVMII